MPKLSEMSIPKLHWPAPFAQTREALGLKVSTAIVATLIIFYQDLVLLFSDALQNETKSYILAIPFIFAYLVYRKRKILRAVMPLSGDHQPKSTRHLASIAGVLLTATAVLLYWHGSYTFTSVEYHMLALPLFVAGLTLVFFNPQTLRQLAFPVAFLFFLMPPPSDILYAAGSTLQVVSAEASNAIMNAFNFPTALTLDNGNPIITLTRPDGSTPSYMVDIASSGIYILIGFTVFVVTIAYLVRDKPWKKAALIIIGIPLVYLLNILRITIMLFIGFYVGDDLALQTFNVLGGFVLIFIGTLILLMISERALKTQIFPKTSPKCVQCNLQPQPGRDYCQECGRIFHPATAKLHKTDLAKVTATILIVVLFVTIGAHFAITQGAPIMTIANSSGQQYSTNILPQTDQYNITFAREDRLSEAFWKEDLALKYLYTPVNKSYELVDVSLEIAPTQPSLQSYEARMRYTLIIQPIQQGKSPQIIPLDAPPSPQLTQNSLIIGHYFVWEEAMTSKIRVALYWSTSTLLMINQTSQQKHVEISLIARRPLSSMDELPAVEQQLLALATTIADYWQPILTWSGSETTLLISQNAITLSTATSAALVVTFLYYTVETRKRRKASLKAVSKLSRLSLEIVEAVQETKKLVTLENLVSTLRKNTGQTIDAEQLEQRLSQLESEGIIKSQICSQNDMPVQTWKT